MDTKSPRDESASSSARHWTWWPTWNELQTHYFKEVGFLACLSQMIGATVFVSLGRFLFLDFSRVSGVKFGCHVVRAFTYAR